MVVRKEVQRVGAWEVWEVVRAVVAWNLTVYGVVLWAVLLGGCLGLGILRRCLMIFLGQRGVGLMDSGRKRSAVWRMDAMVVSHMYHSYA